ncbi:DUF917 domain-containing protein [Fervidicoccus fontis]|uniref:DUF917 domain-containing protein n=1 Tax=Fervidicoccus fontis TaxID=683846 RepID=A0A7C2ZSN6_9CREN|nr:DUF917 domain-containing protein [Fervidicoccus fontis]PMB76283.1 MAG: hypothetical protein C0177_06955 [Fervidicoccus fontis]HEW63531.1 DUF917 domain-containing protein [Fervidicoccus fontis]
MKILKEEDIKNIIVGATFLGSGGGGSPQHGFELLERLKSEGYEIAVTLKNPEELTTEDYVVMVAGIGAPRAFKEKKFGLEAIYAFDTISKISFIGGKNITHLMAGEIGGFNTMVPIYVAIAKGVPIVNADGNGRAVPELGTGLYPTYNIPPNPLVLANSEGDSVVAYLKDPVNHGAAEIIARQLAVGWGMLAAFATWIVNKEQIMNFLAPYTTTLSQKIGEIFIQVKDKSKGIEKLTETLKKEIGAYELFKGKITNLEFKTEGGFDFGTTTIQGEGKYAGKTMTIDFKNENMLAKIDGKIVTMVPDLICMVDMDNIFPLTNADTKEGDKVSIFGLPAPENARKSPKGFECWRHILKKLKYEGDYIPLEKLIGR